MDGRMPMSRDKRKAEGASQETPPIELLEKAMANILLERNNGPSFWSSTLEDFKKALDAALRDGVWDVLDLAFTRIVAASVEMLARSEIALRMQMTSAARAWGARRFPRGIEEDAERFERVSRFLLESAERYSKVRHLSAIARRSTPDGKIISLDTAKAKRSRKDKGKSRKKAKTGSRA